MPAYVRTDYRCSSPVHLISFDSMGFWRSNKKQVASKQQSSAQPAQQPVPQVPAPDASSRGQQDVVSSAQGNSRQLDQITEAIGAAAEQPPTAAATAVAPLVRPAAAPGKAAAGLYEPKRAAGDENLGPKRQAASSPALAALKRRTSAHQPQAPAAKLTAYAGPQHSAVPSPAPAPAADSRAVAAGASEAAPAASVSAPPAPGRVVAARQVRATSDSLCFDDGALLTAATQHGRARPAEAQTTTAAQPSAADTVQRRTSSASVGSNRAPGEAGWSLPAAEVQQLAAPVDARLLLESLREKQLAGEIIQPRANQAPATTADVTAAATGEPAPPPPDAAATSVLPAQADAAAAADSASGTPQEQLTIAWTMPTPANRRTTRHATSSEALEVPAETLMAAPLQPQPQPQEASLPQQLPPESLAPAPEEEKAKSTGLDIMEQTPAAATADDFTTLPFSAAAPEVLETSSIERVVLSVPAGTGPVLLHILSQQAPAAASARAAVLDAVSNMPLPPVAEPTVLAAVGAASAAIAIPAAAAAAAPSPETALACPEEPTAAPALQLSPPQPPPPPPASFTTVRAGSSGSAAGAWADDESVAEEDEGFVTRQLEAVAARLEVIAPHDEPPPSPPPAAKTAASAISCFRTCICK